MINSSCVLMSVYNADDPEYLQSSIRSIDLDIVDKVYIGVDGQIAPDLNHILLGLSEQQFEVLRYDENRGLACVLNDLIEHALGSPLNFEFFFRMDADDISTPNRFAAQISRLQSNQNIDCLGSSAFVIDDRGATIGLLPKVLSDEELTERLCFDSPFIHPSVVIRRRVLETKRYPIDTMLFEDVKFWGLLKIDGCIFENIQQPLLYYRMTNNTIVRRSGVKKSWAELAIRLDIMRQINGWNLYGFFRILLIFLVKVCVPIYIQMQIRKSSWKEN